LYQVVLDTDLLLLVTDLQYSANAKIENPYDLKHLDEHETEIGWLNELLLSPCFELAISDTSTLVDESIDEIARSVPRLSLDLQLMRENALLLRYSLKSIHTKSQTPLESQSDHGQITSVDPVTNQNSTDDTDQLLSHLSTLDLIKERMESARTVLREAEAWSTLESEVTGYLTDPIPSHLKAAERLAEAARSMVVFQHTPEYEGRRGLMQASLSTNLVKALSDKDIRRCKEFYEIFKMIEREGEFKNYYFGSRRSAISSLWSQAILEPPIVTTRSVGPSLQSTEVKLSANSLRMFLAKQFYPELLKLLRTELDFLPSIFNNPTEVLTAFLKSTIHFDPLIENVECAQVLASWPSLVSCWNLTEDVGWKLESLISQLESKMKETTDSTSPTSPILQLGSAKADRRISFKRPTSRSIGSRSGIDLAHHEDSSMTTNQASSIIKDWETSLYEPFVDFQSNYFEREANYLRASRRNITLELTATMIQELPQVLEAMFTLADKALDRCEAFTHGYGALGYAEREYLDTNRQSLISERENRQRRKENSARLDGNHGAPSNKSRGPVGNPSSYLGESASQMLELEGLDYSSEDWEVFQLGLKLLATCKTVHDKLSEYEKKTHHRLVEILATLRSKSADETVAFNEDSRLRGAKEILEQSVLNSSELWEFYETLQHSEQASGSLSLRKENKRASFLLSTGENKRQSNSNIKQMIDHQIVQSIILLPLLKQVEEYPDQTIWTQSSTELQRLKQTNSISTIDLKILNQFSKSPTEAISKLGEGLFNLPRLFEIYTTVDEDALAFSLETLPFVNFFEVLSNWQAFHQSSVSHSPDPSSLKNDETTEREKKIDNHLSSEMVISTWLSSLTLAVVNQFSITISSTFVFNNKNNTHQHLLRKSELKNRLSPDGLAQLLVDLDYLHNVVRALDVEDDVLDKLKTSILD
ncbi:hypothetical protein PSTT_00043, partial [Puccinia striiformis]